MRTDNYIVRVYRRMRNGEHMAGIVEEVGKARTRSFATLDELWAILSGKRRRQPGKIKPDVARKRHTRAGDRT